MNRNKLLILASIILGLILGIAGVIQYLNSYQNVNVQLPDNTGFSLYKKSAEGEGLEYNESDLVFSTDTSVTKKVKKGSYIYTVTPGSNDYEKQTDVIDIGDSESTIQIKPKLSAAKLAMIARDTKPAIEQFMAQKYATIMNGYTIADVQAFEDGNWLGVRINPKSPGNDTYICVFKKEGSGVILATDPPSIILSTAVFPDVPPPVITSTNRMINDLIR